MYVQRPRDAKEHSLLRGIFSKLVMILNIYTHNLIRVLQFVIVLNEVVLN